MNPTHCGLPGPEADYYFVRGEIQTHTRAPHRSDQISPLEKGGATTAPYSPEAQCRGRPEAVDHVMFLVMCC